MVVISGGAFQTLHRILFVTIVNHPGETSDDFVVVVNDLGQHALWQVELDVPPGWHRRSPVMSRRECLADIERSWKDIAPARASRASAALGADGGWFVH